MLVPDRLPPPVYPRVSETSINRREARVPKGGLGLCKYRVLGCGPWQEPVSFGGWAESRYVHGHGIHGVFAFDQEDTGVIFSHRLIGFNDSQNRHYGKDYLNSWIVLPLASRKALLDKWIVLMEMLGLRATDPGEGPLRRYERGKENTQEIL